VYSDLIGAPFVYGGRDIKGFDCFGLIMEMLKRNGVQAHDFGWSDESTQIQNMMIGAAETSMWQKGVMKKNSILLFRVGRFVRHVGFYLGNGKFIHCWERSNGVVIERFNEDWQNRLVGAYQYVG